VLGGVPPGEELARRTEEGLTGGGQVDVAPVAREERCAQVALELGDLLRQGGRPVAEGAASVLWAVDLPDDGPTGGLTRDGRPLPF
jgi:hypothetical protein